MKRFLFLLSFLWFGGSFCFANQSASFADLDKHNKLYSGLLAKYVIQSDDGINRIDYGAWKSNDADYQALQNYVAGFAGFPMQSLSETDQFASWINIYNAVTLVHIIDRYPVKSIRSGYIIGPWKSVKTNVNGRIISLHDIEHEVLRKEFIDPRLHYAVNCASIGCPNLMNKAWTGVNLEADLDAAARAFINHPRGVQIVKGGVRLSKIFKWYRADFGGTEAQVLVHIRQYADADLLAYLTNVSNIRGYGYDWNLNDGQADS